MELHPVQKKLLNILKKNNSNPLSIRDLQSEIEVSSPSVVQHHLRQLEKKGYLKRNPNDPRDFQILSEPDNEITYLNLYGMAQCGPSGMLLDGEPIDRIPVYSPMLSFPASEGFLLKARGDSMEPYIHSGDIVIAQKTKITKPNEIAVCINNGEVLLKKVHKLISKERATTFYLISTNNKYPPFIADSDFHVEGVVRGILKYKVN